MKSQYLIDTMSNSKNLSKDDLVMMFIETQRKTSEFMGRVSTAIEKLNDSNILHVQALQINTRATEKMTTAVESQQNTFKWILMIIIMALVVLAGAEKIIEFIPLL